MRGGEAKEEADFLTMQKDETVESLKTLAKACPNVPATLEVREELQRGSGEGPEGVQRGSGE
eukprot:4326321-Pyramimonas_sp.AAC.1